MKRKVIIVLLISMLLSGCKNADTRSISADRPAETTVFAMDTVMQLMAYGTDETLMKKAADRITMLDGLLSTTKAGSEVYKINQTGSGKVSADTGALLEAGIEYGKMTNGLLDVTIYPLVKAWGFTTDDFKVPDKADILRLLKNIDYRKIKYDKTASYVAIPDGMMVDFGSLAKGYTGDAVLKLFSEYGVTSAMVNLGGNVQTLGKKPDGSSWRVGIENPAGENYLGTVSVTDSAVITSGGYERYFKDDNGNVYWHIFDPRTGYSAKNGLISVTIIADTGIYGEALSTSLFVMGIEKASEFWREHRDFEAVFITEKGDVLITEGLHNNFRLSEHYTGHNLKVISP